MMKYFSTIKVKGSPVICNIPHSSVIIPKEFLSDFLVPKKELEYEKKFMADLYTDVVYKDLCNEFGGIINLGIIGEMYLCNFPHP